MGQFTSSSRSVTSDDVFSFSMTELLLIITFALLLVMVVLNSSLQQMIEAAREQHERLAPVVKTLLSIEDRLQAHAGRVITGVEQAEVSAASSKSAATHKSADLALQWDVVERVVKRLDSVVPQAETAMSEPGHHIDHERNRLVQQDALIHSLQQNVNNLTGQVNQLSNGRELPACWTTIHGRVEYTFDVEVHDTFLIARSVFPAHRQVDYARLEREGMTDTPLTPERFQKMMRPFYEDSRASNPECRYFVRVLDRTAPESKRAWKYNLQAVETVFYKYLSRS